MISNGVETLTLTKTTITKLQVTQKKGEINAAYLRHMFDYP